MSSVPGSLGQLAKVLTLVSLAKWGGTTRHKGKGPIQWSSVAHKQGKPQPTGDRGELQTETAATSSLCPALFTLRLRARFMFIAVDCGGGLHRTTVEVGILRRVGPRHLPTRRTSPTRRAPTPCTTLYDASYIPDASGPDTLYDTARRVVQCRTTLYDAVRHCTTLYDTVRHCTTRRTVSYDAGTTQYDTVRHSTTQYDAVRHSTTLYDTVRHSTTQYDTVRHCTTQYDTVRHSTTQYDASYSVVRHIYVYICMYVYTVRHSTTQYDTVRHSTTLYDTVRHSTTQYDTVRHSTTLYDTVRHSTTQYDTVRRVVQCRTTYICIYMYVCIYGTTCNAPPPP